MTSSALERVGRCSPAPRRKKLAKGRAFDERLKEAQPVHMENIQLQQQQQQQQQQSEGASAPK